ncbi:MAG: hypothetical protein AAB400_04365 [Patescibacteria group bacterium]
MKKRTLPKKIKFRQELFWDVDPKTIDAKKHARYIIERILDHGMLNEMQWLTRQYPRQAIRRVLALPRVQLHAKSKSLWSLVFQKK